MAKRLHIIIQGAVQGVGFRPFIYRLATEMSLAGWVGNSNQGVFIDVEGTKPALDQFLLRIEKEKPPRAFIQSCEFSFLDPIGYKSFEIRHSDSKGEVTTLVLPDISTCPDCLKEIFDPSNHRYLYPFTNCTNCGPRFSIIETLPYDRPNTTMKTFIMCQLCQKEYENPLDRRFHAQPTACSKCGPHLELWNNKGDKITSHDDAIRQVVKHFNSGNIVAVKGLGGFHLIVDARNDEAVNRLRERKHREEKPFALMFPSLDSIKKECDVSDLEERLLLSPESPIVLLRRVLNIENSSSLIASSVAPNNPYLGVMLPYTPLHHILLRELNFPVVATSGNLSDEPICIDEYEALKRLNNIADVFLVHNRPIKRHVDDSIVRVMMGRELVLRRARGYAPLPIQISANSQDSLLAVGAHLKNVIALSSGKNIFLSQHIGDLETQDAFEAFRNVINSLTSLYHTPSPKIIADLHPAYLSTQYAKENGKEIVQIQHHHAHVRSCMMENQIDDGALGVSWDGTGYGIDGTIWGGEFLLIDNASFERVAMFHQFRLPGGEAAIREPRRAAIGMLFEMFGDEFISHENLPTMKACSELERKIFMHMLRDNINSPRTSSVGRLFDAIASLVGVRQFVSFEGQAAMELEFALKGIQSEDVYKFEIDELTFQKHPILINWEPMLIEILNDVKQKTPISLIAAKFHNTLTEIIIHVAKHIGEKRVVLTGGCFQNKYLTEQTVARLEIEGFHPYWHQRVPPNDGGVALGQIGAALKIIQGKNLIEQQKEKK